MYRKLEVLFCFLIFINLFHEFIAFFSCHFVFLCFLIAFYSLCYGETESCMLSVKRTCLLHVDFKKFWFFQEDKFQLVGHVRLSG